MLSLISDHVTKPASLSLNVSTEEDHACRKLNWTVTNTGQQSFIGTIRLRLDLPDYFRNPWLMVPGFVYGENRRAHLAGKNYIRFDPSVVEPRNMTSSWWDFAADRTAAPLVYWHEANRIFAAASLPHFQTVGKIESDDPEPQVSVGFGFTDHAGYIRFSLPACEEPFTYSNSTDTSATIRRLVLPPNNAVSGVIYVYEIEGDRHGYQRVLEHYYRQLCPHYPPAELPEPRALVRDAAHGIIAGHYCDQGKYFIYSRPYDPVIEQIANYRGTTMEWHQMMTGFVNGFFVCHALLAASALNSDDKAGDVARDVADRICRDGVSPSGLFWADFMPRTVSTPLGIVPNPLFSKRNEWGSGWLSGTTRVHSRTIADACCHLSAMIRLERQLNRNASTILWETALLNNLRTALDLQLSNGSYGQYYDAVQRQVVKEDGCGGLLWIPAMLNAIELGLGDESFRAALTSSVRRAADAYAPYVEAEYIWGAPEDNDSPTSEDGMNAVMAYADLFQAFKDQRYLELARRAADWMLTFRKTYNIRIPSDSLMGRYGLRSRGGDYASVSNNHLHVFEALCTRHLCRLSDWTGNPYYRDRARDHWGFVCQYLSRSDGMFNGFRGAMAEQFYWCNWGSWGNWRPPAYHRQKGNMAPFTAVWCIAILPIAAQDALREFNS